jgi:hypothetical protein
MSDIVDLDGRFGVVRDPPYLRGVEKSGPEFTRVLLLRETTKYMKSMRDFVHGRDFFRDIGLSLCHLWIVDVSGQILVTIEECCLVEDLKKKFPRFRHFPLDAKINALGHPCMIGLGSARIAGELVLADEGEGRFAWFLSNRSGRYGFGSDRIPEHLDNVASAFQEAGIEVNVHYLGV